MEVNGPIRAPDTLPTSYTPVTIE